jgi:TfoX/Sxy family transcriptional regulator of competence genes
MASEHDWIEEAKRERRIAALLLALERANPSRTPGVSTGRMFGSEGLKIGERVFAMEVKGKLVVKVSAARAAELQAAGLAKPFDPGHGRLMKQWIAVDSAARIDWLDLAREALALVRR